MDLSALEIVALLAAVTVAIVVMVGGLSMFGQASMYLTEYSYRKEITQDLWPKGYTLLSIQKIAQTDTIWKEEWFFDHPVQNKTVFRQIEVEDRSGKRSVHNVKYGYCSYLPDTVEYDPPLD